VGGLAIEYRIHTKLVALVKMSLNETHGSFPIGQHLPEMFSIKNGLKQRDALALLVFIFTVVYAIKRVQAIQEVLKLSGTRPLMVYDDGDSLLGQSIQTIKKNTGNLLVSSKKIALEVNAVKIKYMYAT
jgi:hypothetical protein